LIECVWNSRIEVVNLLAGVCAGNHRSGEKGKREQDRHSPHADQSAFKKTLPIRDFLTTNGDLTFQGFNES
jgi:hypothetical protein